MDSLSLENSKKVSVADYHCLIGLYTYFMNYTDQTGKYSYPSEVYRMKSRSIRSLIIFLTNSLLKMNPLDSIIGFTF